MPPEALALAPSPPPLTLSEGLRDALPSALRPLAPLLAGPLGLTRLEALLNRHRARRDADFARALLEDLDIRPVPVGPAPPLPSGPLVVVANHPHGFADAFVAIDLVARQRPDMLLPTNRFGRFFAPVRGLVVPVDTPGAAARRNDAARARLRAHLRAGGAVLNFPAGRVSDRGPDGAVRDAPWRLGLAAAVVEAGAAVVPLAFLGQNSASFYRLRRVHPALGRLTLVRELFALAGGEVPYRVGAPVPAARLAGLAPAEVMALLRGEVDALLTPSAKGRG